MMGGSGFGQGIYSFFFFFFLSRFMICSVYEFRIGYYYRDPRP